MRRLSLLTAVLALTLAACGRSAPRVCTDHGDCDPGEVCVAERCRVAGFPCGSDAECPGDELCVDAACVEAPECVEDADCGPEGACTVGVCN